MQSDESREGLVVDSKVLLGRTVFGINHRGTEAQSRKKRRLNLVLMGFIWFYWISRFEMKGAYSEGR